MIYMLLRFCFYVFLTILAFKGIYDPAFYCPPLAGEQFSVLIFGVMFIFMFFGMLYNTIHMLNKIIERFNRGY